MAFLACLEIGKLLHFLNKANQNFINQPYSDLLVLSGGDDHPQRLLVEIEMLKQFRMREKPVLGICHGAFLLTQLWGGELVPIEGHRRTEHLQHIRVMILHLTVTMVVQLQKHQ